MVDLARSELYRVIPLGDNVAREFPWWREGELDIAAGIAYRENRFFFGPNNAPLRSDREKPIKIHEIRFILDGENERAHGAEQYTTVQISHSKYDILNRWQPVMSLNTVEDRGFFGDTASAMFKLPAPYFLQRGQAFKMEIVPLTATAASRDIDICLRGWDPENMYPNVMSQVVTLPAANARVDVVFDENRDAAIRSMWIRDITFGFTEVNAAATPRSITDHLRVRFHPGMGPRWTEDFTIGTRLSGLVHDDSYLSAAGLYRPTTRFLPVAPIILNPREVLTIKARNEIATSYDHTWYCWVIGTQEGRY